MVNGLRFFECSFYQILENSIIEQFFRSGFDHLPNVKKDRKYEQMSFCICKNKSTLSLLDVKDNFVVASVCDLIKRRF